MWPVLRSDFTNFDDNSYVTRNDPVGAGLTWAGLRWAFTTVYAANWHPLTWLSHMADVSAFGLNPAGHHATSLLLHVVATLLLFGALHSLTTDSWRSAFVAALFAVHPAHVESVAWVAERKDLLSAVFWFATMWAYGSWARRRGVGRYLIVLGLFAAGLMSKPMLVSLPVVLLLLDDWPLSRYGGGAAPRVLEKVPLFLMAAASSVVTVVAQRAGGALGTFEKFPLWTRVGNALVAYVRYICMLFWPTNLAVFYPHPGTSLPAWKVIGAALLLAAVSAAAVVFRRSAPYLFVGWFWFVITLLPVIGLVQVGLQALADRYTYLPFVGLFIAITWGVAEVPLAWRHRDLAFRMAAAAALAALALFAARQARIWQNSETLYLHALEVTKGNPIVRTNLGDYYNELGRPADALPHLLEALRLRPEANEVHTNLGRSLFLLGRFDEAAQHFTESLRLTPGDPVAMNNLARTRFQQGEISESVRLYQTTTRLAPDWAETRARLGIALLVDGQTAAAIDQLERTVLRAPQEADYRHLLDGARALDRRSADPAAEEMRRFLAAAHRNASLALQGRGKKVDALDHLRQALELFPAFAEAHNDMGSLLLQEARVDEAAAEYRLALSINPGFALAHNNLGYAFFLGGHREAAIEEYREALRLEPGLTMARNNLERALQEQAEKRKNRRGDPPQK